MHSSSKLPARWRSSALRTGGSRRVSRAFFPSTSFSRQSSSSVGCEFSVALTITEAVGVFSDRNVSCWIPLSHRIRRLFSVSRKIDWRNFSFLCSGENSGGGAVDTNNNQRLFHAACRLSGLFYESLRQENGRHQANSTSCEIFDIVAFRKLFDLQPSNAKTD